MSNTLLLKKFRPHPCTNRCHPNWENKQKSRALFPASGVKFYTIGNSSKRERRYQHLYRS